MRIDYRTIEALHRQARRERAQAVYRLLVAPAIRFFKPSPPRPVLRSRHA